MFIRLSRFKDRKLGLYYILYLKLMLSMTTDDRLRPFRMYYIEYKTVIRLEIILLVYSEIMLIKS